MKMSKLASVMALAGMLPCGFALAQTGLSQPSSIKQTAFAYGSYYDEGEAEGEASPSPSDAPAAEAPAPAPAGAEGAACATCDSGCTTGCSTCESGCDDEPWTLFGDCEHLKCHDIVIKGFIDQGFTANPIGPLDRFNGPNTFNDRANEYQLNQVYAYAEKATDTGGDGWDLGGRVDLLYGTDYRFTTALGLETNVNGTRKWNNDSRFYGLAMPQLYAEAAYNDLKVKIGHFYTPAGYEVVPATGNFFYSHAYTHQYGEPFTHTGVLGTYTATDNLTLMAGFVRGWDNWEDTNDRLSVIGGGTWANADAGRSLAYVTVIGDEAPLGATDEQIRFYQAVVASQQLNEDWLLVIGSDFGNQANAFADGSSAEWYSLYEYLFYTINDDWKAGFRFEWFRDDDGFRVAGLGTIDPTLGWTRGGFAGNFYSATWGLNYKWTPNCTLRPELRYDWYSGLRNANNDLPYDNGTRAEQFTFAIDLVSTF